MILVIRVWADQGANLEYSVPDTQLSEVRKHIPEMIATWESSPLWEQLSEWTWKQRQTGERIEILGIGDR